MKQGDVVGPRFFNAGLEFALGRRLANYGFHVGCQKRLTNVRFAGGLALLAKSWWELARMLELLVKNFIAWDSS